MTMALIILGPKTTALYTNTEDVTMSQTIIEEVSLLGITAYSTHETCNWLFKIIEQYPKVWKASRPIVGIPKSDWMIIPLVLDAKHDAAKVYPLGSQDREVVNKEFDQLHKEEWMEWTSQPIPHGYPIFVV